MGISILERSRIEQEFKTKKSQVRAWLFFVAFAGSCTLRHSYWASETSLSKKITCELPEFTLQLSPFP
jgi:hypothetical protein